MKQTGRRSSFDDKVESYDEFREKTFRKYRKRQGALIDNLVGTSLNPKDKIQLLGILTDDIRAKFKKLMNELKTN